MTQKVKQTAFYHTKIKDWPEDERPREKLLKSGPESLSDAELLAVLIGSGTRAVTAVDLAKRLLVEHRSLSMMAAKGVRELCRMKGIGSARGARILAAFEIGRRAATAPDTAVIVRSAEDIAALMMPRFRDVPRETFLAVLLDGANRVIQTVEISRGILNASLVHPREVFKEAVDHRAAAVIVVHNHPSGDPQPSTADENVTHQLVEAGKVLGIPVLDHLIIGRDRFYSFSKEGRI
jgi:DNA repair protein RadC